MELRGIAASDGIGIGNAICIREQSLDYSGVGYAGKEAEKQRLQRAVEQFNETTQALAERIGAEVGDHEAEILTGQITMLADPFLRSQMEDAIDAGSCAEAAVDQVCSMYADMFAGVEDDMMRQHAAWVIAEHTAPGLRAVCPRADRIHDGGAARRYGQRHCH